MSQPANVYHKMSKPAFVITANVPTGKCPPEKVQNGLCHKRHMYQPAFVTTGFWTTGDCPKRLLIARLMSKSANVHRRLSHRRLFTGEWVDTMQNHISCLRARFSLVISPSIQYTTTRREFHYFFLLSLRFLVSTSID